MNVNDMIKLVIGVVVGVLMVSAILSPTIHASTDEKLTHVNEGMPYAEVDDKTHTITLTSSEITVDGETVDQSLFPSGFRYYSIVVGETDFIRMDTISLAIRVCQNTGALPTLDYSGHTITIEIDGSTATVSSSDTSINETTIENVSMFISPNGEYVLSLNPYVNEDSKIIGAGHTGFTNPTITIYTIWEGDMSSVNGTIVTFVPGSSYSSVTISDTEVNVTDKGNGLYQIDSVLIDYTIIDTSENSYSITSTYTYFLAPATVEYNNPNYVGSDLATMFGVIPLLVTVGIIVGIVGVAFSRRE